MAKKSGLGRGLDVYFSDKVPAKSDSESKKNVQLLRLSLIEPNRNQPRKDFDPAALEELSESIKAHGLLQPLLVRPLENGQYQIIAGERRWRASKLAELTEVPVIIKDISDKEVAEIALVENLQRENLNAIEEADGYQRLMTDFNLTQEEVSVRVGKSRSAIANRLRLLNLPDEISDMIKDGSISAGHGIAILGLGSIEEMLKAAELAKNGANVREIENFSKTKKPPKKNTGKTQFHHSIFKEVELALGKSLSRKVKVTEKNGKGTLQIEFFSEDDLMKLAKSIK